MMKKTLFAVTLITATIVSFLLGMTFSKKEIAKSSGRMQAELSFGHLKIYRDLQSDFLANCRSRAESRLEFMIHEQKMRIPMICSSE